LGLLVSKPHHQFEHEVDNHLSLVLHTLLLLLLHFADLEGVMEDEREVHVEVVHLEQRSRPWVEYDEM